MNIAFNINTDEKVIENWNQALNQIVDDGTYAKIMQNMNKEIINIINTMFKEGLHETF